MTTFVLATDEFNVSAVLCDYLQGRLAPDDVVHAVNSLPDGERATGERRRDGEDALNVVRSRLGGLADVRTRQVVRDGSAAEAGDSPAGDGHSAAGDVLATARREDADEIVVGRRGRESDALGDVARGVVANADRPAVVVPIE